MDITQVVFLIIAAVVVASALGVVISRNLIHAALWLIVTLFGVAALYAVLSAGFLAVVQVVIYIGAIAILFIFAVMLTRTDLRDRGSQHTRLWWLGALTSILVFVGLLWMLRGWRGALSLPAPMPAGFEGVSALGNALIAPDAYVLPFEVASVLLLAALIGAVYVAFNRK